MAKRQRGIVYFPEDIVVREILPRLPARSLFRFRCVSKKICATIDSLDFIKQYLIMNSDHNNSHNTISKTNRLNVLIGASDLYSFSLQGLADQYSLQYGIAADNPLQLRLPLKGYYSLCGSVNGLLFLSNLKIKFLDDTTITILNLATKRYHQLPLPHGPLHPSFFQPFIYHRYFGFGYDSVSKDFKLLRIERTLRRSVFGVLENLSTKAQVYSLRSNSWKIIQDLPANYIFGRGGKLFGEFVCGALHWIVSIPQYEIFALDLVTENHKLVAKPDVIQEDNMYLMSVGKLGGYLSLTCNYTGDRADVWLMKDYGVKESWIKLFSFSYAQEISSNITLTPLAYSERGDEILLVKQSVGKGLLWYNPDTRTTRNIHCPIVGNFQAFICGESMFPLSSKLVEHQL